MRLPGTGKPITTLGKHSVLVRTKLSDAEAGVLADELGTKELEEQAWVKMELIVEQMGTGGKGKPRGKEEEEEEVEEGVEEEGGEVEGEEEKKGRDMSV